MIRSPFVPVRIVDQEEAEAANFLVCLAVSALPGGRPYFADDVFACCAHCRTEIVHRPHAPIRPTKICVACATDHADGGRA